MSLASVYLKDHSFKGVPPCTTQSLATELCSSFAASCTKHTVYQRLAHNTQYKAGSLLTILLSCENAS